MKYVFLAFTLALCIVGTLSCDDSSTKPEGGGGPPNTSPVPTAPGVPAGVAAMGDIGAGGGALASADGLFRLDVPPAHSPRRRPSRFSPSRTRHGAVSDARIA